MAELAAKFGDEVHTEVIEGGGGAFEITLDGELVYSKKQSGRFPRYAEIPALIRERM